MPFPCCAASFFSVKESLCCAQRTVEAGRVCHRPLAAGLKIAKALANTGFFAHWSPLWSDARKKRRPLRPYGAQGPKKKQSKTLSRRKMQVLPFKNSFISFSLCQPVFPNIVGKEYKKRVSFSPFPPERQAAGKRRSSLFPVRFFMKMKVYGCRRVFWQHTFQARNVRLPDSSDALERLEQRLRAHLTDAGDAVERRAR